MSLKFMRKSFAIITAMTAGLGLVALTSVAANADDKAAMAAIQANDQMPDRAKALAGIIEGFNHMASDEGKATLAELFP